jgi:DNA-binding CsgD family transcriptional regulator
MEYIKSFSKTDLVDIFEIIYKLISVRSTDDFDNCFSELQNLFLFDGSMCALSDTDTLKNKNPLYLLRALNFSTEFVERYAKELYYEKSSAFNAAMKQSKPCHWKSYWSYYKGKNTNSIKALASNYGYKDGWVNTSSSYYHPSVAILAFAGQKVDSDRRTESIIECITPHVAESIRGVCHSRISSLKNNITYNLTEREFEILNWIKEGKSSWEISVILTCSERVVIWHANNIMRKLRAQNRPHAVAIAMRHKLIH